MGGPLLFGPPQCISLGGSGGNRRAWSLQQNLKSHTDNQWGTLLSITVDHHAVTYYLIVGVYIGHAEAMAGDEMKREYESFRTN